MSESLNIFDWPFKRAMRAMVEASGLSILWGEDVAVRATQACIEEWIIACREADANPDPIPDAVYETLAQQARCDYLESELAKADEWKAHNKALQAEVERIKDTNQKQYDEGYAHGLAFAKLERTAKGKRLAKFVMTGDPVSPAKEGSRE